MGPPPEIDLGAVARHLNAQGIRFLVFGRRAMQLLGAPVLTADYDVWFDVASRKQVLDYLEDELELELSSGDERAQTVVKAFAGHDYIDAWFVRSMTNREGHRLDFDDLYRRSEIAAEPGVPEEALRIPCLEDMIALKKMAPVARGKDEEDIEFLQVLASLRDRGEV